MLNSIKPASVGLLGGIAAVAMFAGATHLFEPTSNLINSTEPYIGKGGKTVLGVLTATVGVVGLSLSMTGAFLLAAANYSNHPSKLDKNGWVGLASAVFGAAAATAIAINNDAFAEPRQFESSVCDTAQLIQSDDGASVSVQLPTGCTLRP